MNFSNNIGFCTSISRTNAKPQTVNSQPNAFKIISKVLENISEDDRGSRKIEGGHRTGIYNGRSEFNFLIFDFELIKLEVVTSLYVNGSMRRQREAYSELTNYKFINSGGAYGTKIITADWDGYSAKFMMKLTDDKGVDEVYVSIKGESNWEHFTRISVNETQFQELVNTLSVSKIPQNVEKQKVIKLEEITLLETLEKIRKENAPKDNKDYLKIIGRPIKIGNLLVAQYDFPNTMSWGDAKKVCVSLGKGWRLPTQVELNILYLNKKKIGGFADDNYLSSTVERDLDFVWVQFFKDGFQNLTNKYDPIYYVRAVRVF